MHIPTSQRYPNPNTYRFIHNYSINILYGVSKSLKDKKIQIKTNLVMFMHKTCNKKVSN